MRTPIWRVGKSKHLLAKRLRVGLWKGEQGDEVPASVGVDAKQTAKEDVKGADSKSKEKKGKEDKGETHADGGKLTDPKGGAKPAKK